MTSAGADDPARRPSERAAWVLRGLWLVAPLAVGPVVGAAVDDRSDGVQAVASVGAWGAWVVVLVALLVPRATSLTVVRIGVPGALAVYDLPDLAATLAPRPLTIRNPTDATGQPAAADLVTRTYAPVRATYAKDGMAPRFVVVGHKPN